MEMSTEHKKVAEPVRSQGQCFCGRQQPPWLPPLKKTIAMKKGLLDTCQDETAPSTQAPHIFPCLLAKVFQFTGIQIPMASS